MQDAVTICTLGIGTAFGESILDNTPRHATIVSRETSELLRIEQREFKTLWEVWHEMKLHDSAWTPLWKGFAFETFIVIVLLTTRGLSTITVPFCTSISCTPSGNLTVIYLKYTDSENSEKNLNTIS